MTSILMPAAQPLLFYISTHIADLICSALNTTTHPQKHYSKLHHADAAHHKIHIMKSCYWIKLYRKYSIMLLYTKYINLLVFTKEKNEKYFYD